MGNSPKYRSLRGMPDVLPEDALSVRWLNDKARDIFNIFGYKEIRTPILEETDVFVRSIGENTDIVEKEMYTFADRGGKSVSMRPEGTAPIIRAYIEHGWCNEQDLTKLFYAGPMFRGERPQKGRLRQFHQIGAEIIGGSHPLIDSELIFSLDMYLKEIGLDGFTILINSLGCSKDRIEYKKKLYDYLKDKKDELCENCARRAETNVLRVLDCKSANCKKAIEGAPSVVDHLCEECRNYYAEVKACLSAANISFQEKSDLVRGLDYYTGTIFEVIHPALGAQDALAAGGRYDELTRQMGGPDAGAVGYAMGVERLLLAVDKASVPEETTAVMVIPMDSKINMEAFSIVNELRKKGVPADMDLTGRSFKAQLRKANREKRAFVIVIGEDEVAQGKVTLKNMSEGEQNMMSLDEAIEVLNEKQT